MNETERSVRLLRGDEDAPDAAAFWGREREEMLGLLTQQQRVAQAGLFASGLVHDVNNHLQLISGASFLALDTDDPAQWREALQRIQDQCCAATETTRTFLAFSRQQESVGMETFRLSAAVEDMFRLLSTLARHRGVPLTRVVETDADVRGEPHLVRQVLVNLVTNAIKACSETSGEVAVIATRPTPDVARLIVRDTGPGIAEEIRSRIFRPFALGPGGGTGLGLFIVRQIIRSLSGSIRVSTSSDGTTFTVDLPADRAADDDAQTDAAG